MKKTNLAANAQGVNAAKKASVKSALTGKALQPKEAQSTEPKKPSIYQQKVLNRWANLRQQKGKIGFCISTIKANSEYLNLTTKELAVLNAWKKDAKPLLAMIKPNAKSGNFNAFQVFQALYKATK